MLYFNQSLFNRLSSIFGMTQDAFSEKVFCVKHKYKQRILVPERLLVMDLINLCNALHMSISHFFSLSPTDVCAEDKSHYVIDGALFKTIYLENCNIKKIYGKEGLANRRITQLELAQIVGVSQVTLYTWLTNPSQFRVSHLLKICNNLAVPITLLIKDNNVDLTYLEPKQNAWHENEIMVEIKKIADITVDNQKNIKNIAKKIKTYSNKDYIEPGLPILRDEYFANNATAEETIKKLQKENEELREQVARLQLIIDSLTRNAKND